MRELSTKSLASPACVNHCRVLRYRPLGWLAIGALMLDVAGNATADTKTTAVQLGAEVEAERLTPSVSARLGFRSFLKCRSCHTLKKNEKHLVGPNLAGFINQRAASRAGFAYSSSLRSAGIVWDNDMLRRWLKNPTALVPSTKMMFEGIGDEAELDALVDYLKTETVL